MLRALRFEMRFSLFIEQMYMVGVRSVSTTVIAGGFVGAIMAIQIHLQLKDFGATGVLGGLSTSTTIRDIGPVLIAFILSGKVGAFTSAELGTMRVTEQVDAIRCLGTDPLRYLILHRFVAVVASSFLLLIVGLMLTVLGGIFIAQLQLGVNYKEYINNIPRVVGWWSVGMGIFKSFVFGFVIAVISCYRGYHTTGGAEGVGASVRRTSVETLLWIITINFLISSLASAIYDLIGADIL
jgi:phospholipid/cholesterol/gamma-HCH transport system permease protein